VADGRGDIYLTGFMGAGKSTVGRLLAAKLQRPFYDLDAEIERAEGRSIPQIFAEDGEAAFRRMEADCLCDLSSPAVVALGGGAFMTPAVRAAASERGLTVFLEWPFETLLARVRGDANRPLAKEPAQMRRLYETRLPVYRQADIVWRSEPPHRETAEQCAQGVAALIRGR